MSDIKGEATNGALLYMEYGVNEKGAVDKVTKEPVIIAYDNPNEHENEIVGDNPVIIKLERNEKNIEDRV